MMTLVNQTPPSLDTIVLDVIGTYMVLGVPCFSDKLEYQITLYGPKEQEFLLVSVFSTMLRKKCALAYGTSQVY